MKRHILLLVMVCVSISTYSFDLIESYKLDRTVLNEEIILRDYDIEIHGHRYSISEWWQDQPRIQLDYEGEETYLQDIQKALQSLGFVIGSGDLFQVNIETVNDRFLYLETSYQALKQSNMDSLMLIKDVNPTEFRDFFAEAYGSYSKALPKLILIHADAFFEVNGEILYKGPDYSVVKIYEDRLMLTIDNQVMEFDSPFYPVLFLDLSQSQYLLTINSKRQRTIFIDGEMFKTPVQTYLNEGVHQLEYDNRSQYIYLKKQMEISLDEVVEAELTIALNIQARVCILKDEIVVDNFEANGKTLKLEPGTYQLIIEMDGYKTYEQTLTLSSGERLKQEIDMIHEPGTVVYQMKLSEKYTNVLFSDQKVILTKSEESILIDVKSDMITGIQSKVIWFDGDIVVSGNGIKNTRGQTLWSSNQLIINAVKVQGSLWIFTSDKKVISLDMNKWIEQWRRNLDYCAFKIIPAGSNICILDPYARVILINSEMGYRDYFDMRIPGITDIKSVETTKERITVHLKGYEKVIDYYFKSGKTDLRESEREKSPGEIEQKGNTLYQGGKPLLNLSGLLVKAVKKGNHLAILTDEEMVVCTSY